MLEKVGYDQIVGMLSGAAAEIRDNHEMLSKLDSVGGDGDHGTTMVRAMANLTTAVEGAKTREMKTLLYDVGWAIMGVDGGATGPLLGTLFMSMSDALAAEKDAINAAELATMFEAGLTGVRAQTKAQPGDKTMIDALLPAVNAMREAADRGADVLGALSRAAEAAEQGAISTKEMQARFGRAKNIKEKSIGSQDPGATSMSLIFRGFRKGVETHA